MWWRVGGRAGQSAQGGVVECRTRDVQTPFLSLHISFGFENKSNHSIEFDFDHILFNAQSRGSCSERNIHHSHLSVVSVLRQPSPS